MLCASNQRLARRQSPHQRVVYMVIVPAGADDACRTSDMPLPPSGVSSLTRVNTRASRFPLLFSALAWPRDGSPSSAAKCDIDTDHSRREQGEHEEERKNYPAGSAPRGRQDGQKSAHAHQHAQRNQGQCQTLTDGGSLTRGFQDQLLSSFTGKGSLFPSCTVGIAESVARPDVFHCFVLKHTVSPFKGSACRHPDRVLSTHSPGCLHLFKPAGNPRIFIPDAPGMKGEDPLSMGHRDARSVRTIIGVCQVLHGLQIRETSLKIGLAAGQDRLALWHLQIVEEGDTGKKLGVIGSLRGGKISQRGLQQ